MRRRLLTVCLAVAAACSQQSNPAPDAGGGPDAGSPTDAGPCGPLTDTLQRCAVDPLVHGWYALPGIGQGWTAADPKVLFDASAGLWKAWWSTVETNVCDLTLETTDNEIDIMYAESPDGLTWTMQLTPAFRSHYASGAWDYSTVETPTVIQVPDAGASQRFALLYAGANNQKTDAGFALPRVAGNPPWQLGLAYSADGKSFTRLPAAQSPYFGRPTPFGSLDGLVLYVADALPAFPQAVYGGLADPDIIQVGSTYHLFFSSAGTDALGHVIVDGGAIAYGIGHATSTDLIHWTADPGNPLLVGGGQPSVVLADGGTSLQMYFSRDSASDLVGIPSGVFQTRGFYRATSTDASQWQVDATREWVWDGTSLPEDLGLLRGASAVVHAGELRLYYGAWTDQNVPPGSCLILASGAVGPGVQVLNLARKRAP